MFILTFELFSLFAVCELGSLSAAIIVIHFSSSKWDNIADFPDLKFEGPHIFELSRC
jgi:hypothetical protein